MNEQQLENNGNKCNHKYKKVNKVIDHANYIIDKCMMCGFEKDYVRNYKKVYVKHG